MLLLFIRNLFKLYLVYLDMGKIFAWVLILIGFLGLIPLAFVSFAVFNGDTSLFIALFFLIYILPFFVFGIMLIKTKKKNSFLTAGTYGLILSLIIPVFFSIFIFIFPIKCGTPFCDLAAFMLLFLFGFASLIVGSILTIIGLTKKK